MINFAKIDRRNALARLQAEGIEADFVAHRRGDRAALGQRQQLGRLVDVHRQRFLADDVLADGFAACKPGLLEVKAISAAVIWTEPTLSGSASSSA